MKTSDFYFDLPESLIAQTPLEDRSSSRLMKIDKKDGKISHKRFYNVLDDIKSGDCLVLNNTKVIPARLFGSKETGAVVEFLLLKRISLNTWETLVKPGKKAKIGTRFTFGYGRLMCDIIDIGEEGSRIIEFIYEGVFEHILEELGSMPLPPYITAKLDDPTRYNTVYAKHEGSAAAPTAGLHFTDALLEEVAQKGATIAFVTLHVGLGTFRPVKVEDVNSHKMHSEYYILDEENAQIINKAKAAGGRIISVGTTSTRTLETIAEENGHVKAQSGWTEIFIYPGYKFKLVDGLITNFHLPESTLIMLVSAFLDKKTVLDAYQLAVDEKYRFFSFGDAMLII
ncbi:tRNA preQ1(34) S-adenosylmethionine ribosyltransferase-isomerase QueA [Fusibacter bizertensis]|uniref:S-adenosylmethionine:tRNA ribosyltransferase-isomerase n=1 Tax=Fusibacter bizertensis TaxID=1488331 RepID=A0ABT6N9Q1_9FIRM|nr:tRNA preQ1(34) S-adenosylmethionine ribosyltransferase-isomerase QueA [Fusibacter bizertensis]MDH8677144.1 tRNA preQ1(34) S-adenosylmethionine ribosyltransferase-isomerase QueA [Fusibacter bizertensis]